MIFSRVIAATMLLSASTALHAADTSAAETVPSFIVSPEDTVAADNQSGPLFLALFGDSVSMATMADAKLGNPGPRFYADFLGSIAAATVYGATIGKLNPNPTEEQQHQLLTKLFGNMARIRLSPYLGTQSYSLPVLIKQTTGFEPKVYNGAQMAGSYHFGHLYLEKFEAFFKRNPFHKKPELIIVNFNGMDFMDNRTPESYAESVRGFYQRLTALSPYSKIVVTGLGDPIALLTHPDRVAVPHSPNGPITCTQLYKIVRFANDTGVFPGAPQENIDAARRRIAALRDVLANEIRLMNHDQTVYPNFKGQAVYVAPGEDDGSAAEHIAADCIHPDVTIQEAIGHHMWDVVAPLL